MFETTGSVPSYAWESLSSLCLDFAITDCQTAVFGAGIQNIVKIESEIDNPILLITFQMNT